MTYEEKPARPKPPPNVVRWESCTRPEDCRNHNHMTHDEVGRRILAALCAVAAFVALLAWCCYAKGAPFGL
jgi:hypothetical protein